MNPPAIEFGHAIGDGIAQTSAQVVLGAIEAARAGRAEEFIACFAEQVEFWMPGSTPISGRWHDRAGFVSYAMKVWSYLDVPVRLEVDGVIAAGEWVVTPCRGHGVTKHGEDYDNVYCLLWRVRDGLIVSFVEYCDTDLINSTLCR